MELRLAFQNKDGDKFYPTLNWKKGDEVTIGDKTFILENDVTVLSSDQNYTGRYHLLLKEK